MKLLPTFLMISMLILTGCERVSVERQVVWAKMGSIARIVDDRKIKVMIKDSTGSWITADASLQGMVAVDEPTINVLLKEK